MIYIPEVKKRIEKLKPRWEKGKLSLKELNEFYKLLDEVVIESRKERSAHVIPDQTPEKFLLNLLKNRIENTVFHFLRNKNQPYENLPEWFGYAQKIVRFMILGDKTKRQDRRKEVMPFLEAFESSEKKLLTLNYRQVKGTRDGMLGQEKRKDLDKLKRPEAIKEAERLSREFELNDLWAGLENIKGDGFLIRDNETINAALEYALSKGIGYDPDYKLKKLKELIELQELANTALSDWDEGNLNDNDLRIINVNSKTNYINWIEKKLIGIPLKDLNTQIETFPKKSPNLIAYLFGSRGKKGMLYYRLLDLYIHKAKNRKRKNEISLDVLKEDKKYKDKLEYEAEAFQSFQSIENKIEWDSWLESLPTKRQTEIARLYFINNRKQSDIAKMLNISRQAVNSCIKRIIKHTETHLDDLPPEVQHLFRK